jgi:hypothetical protein
MSISLRGGAATRKARYAARGQSLIVVGTVKPFVAGQLASVLVIRKGKVSARYRAPISQTRRGGRFVVRFKVRRQGQLRIIARHRATPQQAAFRSRSRRVKVVRWHAGEGASGTHVLILQRLLRSLGYPSPVTGGYDQATSLAVLAFRKVNHMGRSGSAGTGVYDKVLRRRGRFKLRHPRAGKHVEFDWSRQVVVLADRGRAWRVYHASSGTSATPTVFGSYRFYSKQAGVNSKQMLHSNYFIGGYAIHGYPSVPNYPASHGCIRVPNRSAGDINSWIRLGDPIFSYR